MNEKEKENLRKDVYKELTDLLNMFVESTSFDEDEILEVIKEQANKMPYLD